MQPLLTAVCASCTLHRMIAMMAPELRYAAFLLRQLPWGCDGCMGAGSPAANSLEAIIAIIL